MGCRDRSPAFTGPQNPSQMKLFGFHTQHSACELSLGLLSYRSSKIAISLGKRGVTLKKMDWVRGWTGLRPALAIWFLLSIATL